MFSCNDRGTKPKRRACAKASSCWHLQQVNEWSGPQWSALHLLLICAEDPQMVEENFLLPSWVFHGQQLHTPPGSMPSSRNQTIHCTWLPPLDHWGLSPRAPPTIQPSIQWSSKVGTNSNSSQQKAAPPRAALHLPQLYCQQWTDKAHNLLLL